MLKTINKKKLYKALKVYIFEKGSLYKKGLSLLSKELLSGAELIDKNTETERIDEETVKVTVTMRFIEEIGTEKRIDEVTDFEPKTD